MEKAHVANNRRKLVSALFLSYYSLLNELALLKISARFASATDKDEEIASLCVSHPVGGNDSGKSSVTVHSEKTADIALGIDEKLANEVSVQRKRIALLGCVTAQIGSFLTTVDSQSAIIFTAKRLEHKTFREVCVLLEKEGVFLCKDTIARRCREIEFAFSKISPLTDDEMKHALQKLL